MDINRLRDWCRDSWVMMSPNKVIGFSEGVCVNLDCEKMTEKLYLCIATGTFYCTNAKYTNAVSQIAS